MGGVEATLLTGAAGSFSIGLLALVILDGFILNYILKGRLRAKFGTVERGKAREYGLARIVLDDDGIALADTEDRD